MRIMRKQLFILLSILLLSGNAMTQNLTDAAGKKQGPWVKNYPNGKIMYEGTFKDDKPVGLFKRYTEEGMLLSELTYTPGKDEATAVFYYGDGTKAAEGKYVARKKEGLWQFWSATQPPYLISEENYLNDTRHGLSVKYYPDSTLAEKVAWDMGNRSGEWLQYYPGGSICLRAEYMAGKLEGPFSYYHPNGKLQFEGRYLNDRRTGDWMIFNEDGSLKQIIAYKDGVPSDPKMADQETRFLDDLEKKKGRVEVTDITGTVIK
jgi:antitoxin component YwqK of YwqJK toxin-antitoxin module